MKGKRIIFRLTPYQLARGLQVLRQLDPNYKLTSINELVKTLYHDYLAKMTLNRLDEVPAEIMAEITSFIDRPASNQLTVDDLINLKSKPESEGSPEFDKLADKVFNKAFEQKEIDLSDEILDEINKISNQTKAEQTKASKFNDPNKTDSDISSITDFSPPEDWKE